MRDSMIAFIKKAFKISSGKTSGWITRYIQGTHDHYLCHFPARPKALSHALLKVFFQGVRLDAEQTAKLSTLESDAIVILATKFKSTFDFLFCHTRSLQSRLTPPEIGLGYHPVIGQPFFRFPRILVAALDHFFRHKTLPDPYHRGYIRRELLAGKRGYFSLVEDRGFYRRFVKAETDPIEYLIALQRTTQRPVYIVPHLMFFGKKPLKAKGSLWDVLFGTDLKPKFPRKLLILLRNPGGVFMEISEPVSLREFLAEPENQSKSDLHLALLLRRRLLVQFNRHRQSITGPMLKSREELKESILTNERLAPVMAQIAQKRNIPLTQVHREANKYIDEIAANYNNSVVEVGAKMIKWLISTLFDGLSINNDMLLRIKSMSRRGPLILVPCHKSHIDYLVLSYLLFLNDMPCPHVVAGKNLFFWPAGSFFRATGAFSVRRSFKGAVLYAKVFSEYVHKLLEEGFNLELYIEGGRSRTGKLLPPQLGFLSILLGAFKNHACEDLIFVPIHMGYDRVPEEKAYLHEIEGGSKEPESLKQILRAGTILKKRYGRIYVKLAEPVSLRDMLAQQNLSIDEMDSKQINTLCKQLGNRMITAIAAAAVVTPHALTAASALSFPKKRFSRAQLIRRVQTLMAYLTATGACLSETLLLDPEHAASQAMDIYGSRKFIEPIPMEKEEKTGAALFGVVESKRPNLEYYKNNCVGYLVPAAYTALAILARDAFQFSAADLPTEYEFLQTLLEVEFAVDGDKPPVLLISRTMTAFVNDAILVPHPTLPDTYNLTSAGFRKLGLFAQLLKPYLEAYLVVLQFLTKTPKADGTSKDRVKKIQSMGQRMYRFHEIDRLESLSKISYENALDQFASLGIRGAEDTDAIALHLEKLKKYLSRIP